jgi:hypothetical protein
MFRKDYIMRMLEEFIRVMAKIVLLKETKKYYDAGKELDSLSRLVTGFSTEHLVSLGSAGIKYVFSQNKESEAEKIYCSARIIKEEAMICEAEGKHEESLKRFQIAGELFKIASEFDFPERDDSLKEYDEFYK